MIATQWRQPHQPSDRDLGLLDLLSRQAADLMERTQAETAVRESASQLRHAAQKLEAAVHVRDEFLSTASHELRNPVNAIQLQLVGLLRATEKSGEAYHVRGPASGSDRRSTPPKTGPAGRHSRCRASPRDASTSTSKIWILDNVLNAVISRFQQQVKAPQIAASLASVTGSWDRLRLEQVVTNLLSNAMAVRQGNPIEISLESDGRLAYLAVTDHGVGIAPAEQKRPSREVRTRGVATAVCGVRPRLVDQPANR